MNVLDMVPYLKKGRIMPLHPIGKISPWNKTVAGCSLDERLKKWGFEIIRDGCLDSVDKEGRYNYTVDLIGMSGNIIGQISEIAQIFYYKDSSSIKEAINLKRIFRAFGMRYQENYEERCSYDLVKRVERSMNKED